MQTKMSSKTTKVLKVFKSRVIFPRRYRYSSNIDPLPTRYGGKTNITVLPGVGIGPEIMEATLKVLKAAQAPLSYEILTLEPSEKENRDDEFQEVLTSIRRNRVALKGNIEIRSRNPYAASRNILLRKTLDLYVYVLHCKTLPVLKNKFGEIDIVVIRQNTEGEYLMLEHEPTPESVESLKIVSRQASERLARFAFKYAMENQRKMVTVVHSAQVQTRSEGLFVEAALTVSRDFPMIKVAVVEIGAFATSLIITPSSYDIILLTNLNGSMISNILNGMVGGPGVTAGINLGDRGLAVFEPGARNKASSIVGKGIANPIAMIRAGINLLDHLGYHKTSQILQHAVYATLVHDKIITPDLGGTATTNEVVTNVIRHIRKQIRTKTQNKEYSYGRWRTYCEIPPSDETKKS